MKDVVDTYSGLSQAGYARGADFVVWPETAVRAPVMDVPELRARLLPTPEDRVCSWLAWRKKRMADSIIVCWLWHLAVLWSTGIEK